MGLNDPGAHVTISGYINNDITPNRGAMVLR